MFLPWDQSTGCLGASYRNGDVMAVNGFSHDVLQKGVKTVQAIWITLGDTYCWFYKQNLLFITGVMSVCSILIWTIVWLSNNVSSAFPIHVVCIIVCFDRWQSGKKVNICSGWSDEGNVQLVVVWTLSWCTKLWWPARAFFNVELTHHASKSHVSDSRKYLFFLQSIKLSKRSLWFCSASVSVQLCSILVWSQPVLLLAAPQRCCWCASGLLSASLWLAGLLDFFL